MTITAFSSAPLQLQLGMFDAGWWGTVVAVTPLRWRPVAQTGRLRWHMLTVREPHWEER